VAKFRWCKRTWREEQLVTKRGRGYSEKEVEIWFESTGRGKLFIKMSLIKEDGVEIFFV
jgi:hypothetical protein